MKLIDISFFIIIISVIILLALTILSQMNEQTWSYYSNECNSMNGKLIAMSVIIH